MGDTPLLLERWQWWVVLILAVVGAVYGLTTTGSTVGAFVFFVLFSVTAFAALFAGEQLARVLRA